ncbi:MAG: hypothetical protein EOO85_11600 [Pedobacter sp.]|nr:MAG: hypothetical protein EOO85_11600 [Pedobacter sp.]
MKKYIHLMLSFWLLVVFSACQPELPILYAPETAIIATPEQEFDVFWNGMNNNYVFWDRDPTDWDAMYRKYKPLFAQLKFNEADMKKAHTYYEEMTANLIDSHYAVLFTDGRAPILPSKSRVGKRPNYHEAISNRHYTTVVRENYLAKNSLIGVVQSDDKADTLVAGKIKNTNVLYFRFSSFALKSWYLAQKGSVAEVLNYIVSELHKTDLDGVIIDMRGNGGGDASDLDFLIGQLTDKPYVFGSLRSKAGMGRLDYLPWVPASVNPLDSAQAFIKPVIALVDMHSVSMSEITSMAIKALPNGNGRVVGERTWGGNGPLTSNIFYNDGQFTTGGRIKLVYTSSQMLRYKDGIVYEGLGFPPDIEAPYDEVALKVGKDTQLEKAIAQIH